MFVCVCALASMRACRHRCVRTCMFVCVCVFMHASVPLYGCVNQNESHHNAEMLRMQMDTIASYSITVNSLKL